MLSLSLIVIKIIGKVNGFVFLKDFILNLRMFWVKLRCCYILYNIVLLIGFNSLNLNELRIGKCNRFL